MRLADHAGNVEVIETRAGDWAHSYGDDIAALRIDHRNAFEMSVPLDLFVDETCHIGEWPIFPGDEVELFGRFVGHDGRQLNKPVVRFGNVSMLPDPADTVRINQKDQLAFLVECRSLSGFSGSPAFVRLSQPRHVHPLSPTKEATISNAQMFLGLDCGHFPNWSQARERPEPTANRVPNTFVETNSGIAVVVPAWRIALLLERDDFADERRRIERSTK